jgi:rhodanese-related sulfurtransferase
MNVLRFALAVASAAIWVSAGALAEDSVPGISPAELHAEQQNGTAPLVLDVRTPEEFATGHVAGAVNIPHTELGARLSEVQSENGVALYCMVGPRARLGEKTLQEAGVVKVFHLEGGLAAWQEAGLPVEQGAD